MRLATLVAVTFFTSSALFAADGAQAAITHYELNIPRQPLDTALKDLAQQTGMQIGRFSDAIKGDTLVGPVSGSYSAEQALKNLLAPAGLTYRSLNKNALIVLRPQDAAHFPAAPGSASTSSTAGQDAGEAGADSGHGVTQDRLRLAQTTHELPQGVGSVAARQEEATQPTSATLQEIIVTAQKREERLQDVPASVTAINPDSLLEGNHLRLQDYYTSVPGLSLVSNGSGAATLSIRGITTGGAASPTVGIVVDDAPFGVSTALTYRVTAPDIDPSDLARVEVLSGPQGTLYGASSIGGLLKFVTVDPSTTALSGRVEASGSSVYNGAEPGYSFRGAVNVPVTDSFAVRASAFTRRDPGYVDGVYSGPPPFKIDGINDSNVKGGRISALWRPAENWSVKASALLQNTNTAGTSYVTLPATGSLEQQIYVRGVHGFTDEIRSYTGTVSGTFAGMKLVSITGYNTDKFRQILDLSNYPGLSGESEALYGVAGAQVAEERLTKKFTEEVRLSGSLGTRTDWLLGLFYTHEDTPTHDIYQSVDPTTVASVGLIYDDPYPTTYSEYAIFSDVTFHITDRLDFQVGGRESQNRQSYTETLSGAAIPDFYGLPSPLVNPAVHTKDNAFTFLATPSYKFSQDLMGYVRVASGYRPGGPNPTCILFEVPCHFQPDKTIDYELGVKGEGFQNRLSFNVSAYYIDWKDIQLQVFNEAQTASFFTNASTAKSQGLELALQARPFRGMKAGLWLAWNDATLTADMPPNGALAGNSGDRLPYSSRFSGNLSLEQEFPLTGALSGYGAVDVSYAGDRRSDFTAAPNLPRLILPSYVLTNLRAGLRWDSWTLSLFLNNAANQRGEISGGTIPQTTVIYIQPRTVGMTVAKTFRDDR